VKRPKLSPQGRVDALEAIKAGKSKKEVCAACGISQATLYNWKKEYTGMSAEQIACLDELKQQHVLQARRIKALEQDVRVLQDAVQMQGLTPDEKRRAIEALIRQHQVSLDRACRLMKMSYSFFLYQPMRKVGD
jgi:putative transposase